MITENSYIGEIVARDIKTAVVFESVGIDYCCRGNRTLFDVCKEQSLEIKSILEKLLAINSTVDSTSNVIDYNSWPLTRLVDHIVHTHHKFVRSEIPLLQQRIDRICTVHGEHHPELFEVNKLFNQTANELLQHMVKEERMLFPQIKALEVAANNNEKANKPLFGSVTNPIEMMMQEHTNEGDRFVKIAKLTNNYIPPVDACNTYKVTFQTLKEFEQDLHRHIHLENNILFPKAERIEKELKA
ncbi:MAG: iron-sulfur cluster repair di-iron protein [Proteobacteria bacterium]|jgi:regulator of cell morphogenesis and NO signaling|nr:iron-sulfur cluster repair di-iron protein [Pseudomonadota bacterium]